MAGGHPLIVFVRAGLDEARRLMETVRRTEQDDDQPTRGLVGGLAFLPNDGRAHARDHQATARPLGLAGLAAVHVVHAEQLVGVT